jgi:hypothetical protein
MKIWKLLLLLYMFSVILSIGISFLWMFFSIKGEWDSHLVPLTIVGALFLNLPLTFIELPGLFISINFKKEKNKALIFCIITPVAILGYVLIGSKLQYGDKEFYAIQLIAQLLVISVMFFKGLTPNNVVEEE